MYAGHFAAALALKTVEPKAPSSALFVGTALLDLLFGLFILLGLESARGGLYIPWSHSLLTSLLWAALFAVPFHQRGRRVMAVIFVSVFSHWVLDLLVHTHDLGLWPHSRIQLGLGAWFGHNAGWMETGFTLAACGWYAWHARTAPGYGRRWPWACAVIGVCYLLERMGT
jgi:hypothetical protein